MFWVGIINKNLVDPWMVNDDVEMVYIIQLIMAKPSEDNGIQAKRYFPAPVHTD